MRGTAERIQSLMNLRHERFIPHFAASWATKRDGVCPGAGA